MSFLLVWSLRAFATILLGLLLSFALRRRSAAARNLGLRITLGVGCLLPLLAAFAPRVEVAMPTPTATASVKSVPTVVATTPAPDVDLSDFPAVVDRQPYQTTEFDLTLLVVPIYLLGVGGLVVQWLVGFVRLRRIARKGVLLDDSVRRVAIAVPATYGRTILLPLESEAWPEARLRAAVLHERAHVRRRDWYWQTLASLFAAIHWANPAAWLLLRALRDTAEAAADDEALQGMRPSDYARELLAVAAKVGGVGPAVAMTRRGGVANRIVGVLSSARDRRVPTRRTGALLLLPIGLVGFAIAGIVAQKPAEDLGPFAKRLQDGRILRLVAVRNPRKGTAWSPEGGPAPEAYGHSGGVRSSAPGETREFRFIIDGDDFSDFDFQGSSWGGWGTNPYGRTMLSLGCDVPKSDLFVALVHYPVGPWKRSSGEIPFTVKRKGVPPEGTAERPRFHVSFRPPKVAFGTPNRLVGYDGSGKVLVPPTGPSGSGERETLVFDGVPPTRIELQTRDLAWAEFPNVPLDLPKPAFSAVQTNSSRIELLGLAENGRAWRADGTPAPELRPLTPKLLKTPKLWRRLSVGFRVRIREQDYPWIRAIVRGRYA